MQTDARPRVTLARVAREAGVHLSTASRALRNLASISEAERARIGRIARSLGYRPDPAMARLCAYRHAGRNGVPVPPQFGLLAVLPASCPERDVAAGFLRCCKEMGYGTQVLPASALHDPESLRRLYLARGLDGFFAIAHTEPPDLRAWKGLRAVWFGEEAMHTVPVVHTDIGGAAVMAFAKALEGGSRRIAGVFHCGPIRERGSELLGAFLQAQYNAPADLPRLPPLVLDGSESRTVLKEKFLGFLADTRPDALLGHSVLFHHLAVQAGWEIPQKIQFISLSAREDTPGISGTDLRYGDLGLHAARTLDLLYKAGRVLPMEESPRISVRPLWRNGKSFIPRRPSRPRRKTHGRDAPARLRRGGP